MVWTPLILDTFVFDEAHLETPEAFGDIGGHQAIEQHDFPGGTRTQKAYGYFPAQLRWRARFHGSSQTVPASPLSQFLGNLGGALLTPSDRAHAVGRIVAAGKEVKLQYGDHSWLGRVAKFTPTVRNVWLYEYELEFWPRLDYANPGTTVPLVTDLGTVLALHLLSITSLIQYGLNPDLIGQVAAAEIGGSLGFFASQVQDTLSAAGGNVNNISQSERQSLQTLSTQTLATLTPYRVSNSAVISSPAADGSARVSAIATVLAAQQPTKVVVQTLNPNLAVLAAKYYGDAAQWRQIAAANGLSDPQPLGSYNLTIPEPAH